MILFGLNLFCIIHTWNEYGKPMAGVTQSGQKTSCGMYCLIQNETLIVAKTIISFMPGGPEVRVLSWSARWNCSTIQWYLNQHIFNKITDEAYKNEKFKFIFIFYMQFWMQSLILKLKVDKSPSKLIFQPNLKADSKPEILPKNKIWWRINEN